MSIILQKPEVMILTNYFHDLYQPHEDETFDELTRNKIDTAFTHIKEHVVNMTLTHTYLVDG